MVSFRPRPPYPLGKSHQYPLIRRLDGIQSRSGRGFFTLPDKNGNWVKREKQEGLNLNREIMTK